MWNPVKSLKRICLRKVTSLVSAEEPIMKVEVITPEEYMGNLTHCCRWLELHFSCLRVKHGKKRFCEKYCFALWGKQKGFVKPQFHYTTVCMWNHLNMVIQKIDDNGRNSSILQCESRQATSLGISTAAVALSMSWAPAAICTWWTPAFPWQRCSATLQSWETCPRAGRTTASWWQLVGLCFATQLSFVKIDRLLLFFGVSQKTIARFG